MKYMRFLVLAALLVTAAYVVQVRAAEDHPSGKTVTGTLSTDNPRTVQDGEDYFLEIRNAPLNSQVRLWVDTGEGKGFRDFGIIGTTKQSNTAYAQVGDLILPKTLNCASYEYLEPGKNLSVGNRDIFQQFYVEYVGLNKVSNVDWSIRDCSQTGDAVSTGDQIFPYTLESIYGRNHIVKAFPDSYPSGIPASLKFAGRYFDGRDRGGINMGLGFEWFGVYGSNVVGGNPIKMAGNKIYAVLGSTIAAYNKDTFVSRLANNTNNSLAVFAGQKENNSSETLRDKFDHGILPWDAYIYPEHKSNAWLREACDCHTGITWFEVDDRGYVYFIDRFGFGIARSSGSSLNIFRQVRSVEGLSFDDKPITIPWYRTAANGTIKIDLMDGYEFPLQDSDRLNMVKTGGRYYIAATGPKYSGNGGTRVVDVTDPNNPKFSFSNPDEYITALSQAGDKVIALVNNNTGGANVGSNEVRIYDAADFVIGSEAKKTFSAGEKGAQPWQTPNYRGLAVDHATGRAYSIHYSSHPNPGSSIPNYTLPQGSISVFSPNGGSYTEQRYDVAASLGGKGTVSGWGGYDYIFVTSGLSYSNGYLAAYGSPSDSDVKIWDLKNGTPQEINTNGFLNSYYGQGDTHWIYQATLQPIGGKVYLFVSTLYLADVYEITGATATDPTDPFIPPGPTSTPTTTPQIPFDPDIFKKSCEELYAGKPALIMLCKQVNFVQERSCSMVPGLPFCKENLDAYMAQ